MIQVRTPRAGHNDFTQIWGIRYLDLIGQFLTNQILKHFIGYLLLNIRIILHEIIGT